MMFFPKLGKLKILKCFTKHLFSISNAPQYTFGKALNRLDSDVFTH